MTAIEPLDTPPWAALTTAQRGFSKGNRRAVRYLPSVAPFAAVAEQSPECFAALLPLLGEGGRVALQTLGPIDPGAPFGIEAQEPIFQMLADPAANPPPGPDHAVLGAGDVAAMMDLTARTKPGPFKPRTIELGHYIGIRHGSTLAAMAGERMRFGRYVEISAVCTDPAFRGRGLATVLMLRLARRIQDQGMVPILHVFQSNAAAIALYERLGFAIRRSFVITVLSRR